MTLGESDKTRVEEVLHSYYQEKTDHAAQKSGRIQSLFLAAAVMCYFALTIQLTKWDVHWLTFLPLIVAVALAIFGYRYTKKITDVYHRNQLKYIADEITHTVFEPDEQFLLLELVESVSRGKLSETERLLSKITSTPNLASTVFIADLKKESR